MEPYKCTYRDPHSPLTPLTPISEFTLRQTLRDHSPSLMPMTRIVLDKCPPPKRNRLPCKFPEINRSSPLTRSAENTLMQHSGESHYLQNLKRILVPTLRHTPKSLDLGRVYPGKQTSSKPKRLKFKCFKVNNSPPPMSPRVSKILKDIGMEKYRHIFLKEEIDLTVFKILTISDLEQLGISDEKDIPVILKAIRLVKNL